MSAILETNGKRRQWRMTTKAGQVYFESILVVQEWGGRGWLMVSLELFTLGKI
jgi:hypothetical protein